LVLGCFVYILLCIEQDRESIRLTDSVIHPKIGDWDILTRRNGFMVLECT